VGATTSASAVDTLTRLEAIEEIKQLKARYFRAIDTKDWALLRRVFADDAVLDTRSSLSGAEATADPAALFTGGDAVADYIRSAVGGAVTVHYGMTPEISLLSVTEAEGAWKMEDIVDFSGGASEHPRLRGVRGLHGYGYYHERYRKIDGQWRIVRCQLTRLKIDFDRD